MPLVFLPYGYVSSGMCQ